MDYFKKIFPIILFGTFLAAILLPFYKDGKMISGGEGAYFLDFPLMLKNYGYSWLNSGVGMFATSLNFGYVFHLSFFQSLVQDVRIINFMMIFSLYFLPFSGLYILSLSLGLNPLLAVLMATFYITNPFIANFMKSINQWNMLAAYVLPSFFLIIFKFYNQRGKLFFFFGLNSLVFSFTNANPPTMVLYQVAIILFILIISFYKEQKIRLKSLINNYITVVLSFFVFNCWWIINWLYVFTDAGKGYSKQVAISWLRSSGGFIPAFWRSITLTSLLQFPINLDYDYFAKHYSRFFVPLTLTIPIIILAYFYFVRGIKKKFYLLFGIIFILVGFLAKGVNGVFGGVYEFMVMYIPFFSIFKSAEEKWGLLFTFFLTILLIFAFKELRKDRFYRLALGLMTIYIFYCSIPFATGNFLADYNFQNKIIGSKGYSDKKEYVDLRNNLNEDPLQYRVLSLPGSNNYQVALHLEGKRFYTGNDPILSNTTKPFIAPYTGAPLQDFNSLYDAIPKPSYPNIFGLFNIKKIVVNKDMYPWFGFREKMTALQTEEFLNKKFTATNRGAIDLYDASNYFLPRFYVPENIIFAPNASPSDLPLVVGIPDFRKRSAVFLGKALEEQAQKNLRTIEQKASVLVVIPEVRSTDEKKLREGNFVTNPAGVLFPYVRWRPGSLLYQYVLKKEHKAKDEVPNQPILAFDRHLFYAAKRISEIEKWDRDFADQEFKEILEKYENEVVVANEKLDWLIAEEEDAYPFLMKMEVSLVAHEKRLLDVLKGDFGPENNERLDFAKSLFDKIANRLEETIQKKFSNSKYYKTTVKNEEYDSSALTNLAGQKFIPTDRYYFNIGEDGQYELIAEKPNVPLGWKIVRVNSKEASFEYSLEESFKYWDLFGQPYLDQGKHYFSFIGTSKNLLNPNFTFLDRLDQEDINGISMTLLKKTPASEKIIEWQSGKRYKLSFKYRGDKGKLKVNLAEYLSEDIDETWYKKGVENKPSRGNFAVNEVLELDSNWKDYTNIIQSSQKVDFANIFFLTNLPTDSSQPAQIEDLKLEEMFEPKMMLTKPLPNKFPLKMPKITFQKINPAKYFVRVEDATTDYLLVFSENFHRGWKAYVDTAFNSPGNIPISETYFDGEIKEVKAADIFFDKDIFQTINKKPIPENRHLLINGYANSWLITPEDANNNDSYTIIIEYWPQKLFYSGAIVTTMAILICLVSFLIRLKKTNAKKTPIS